MTYLSKLCAENRHGAKIDSQNVLLEKPQLNVTVLVISVFQNSKFLFFFPNKQTKKIQGTLQIQMIKKAFIQCLIYMENVKKIK